MWGKVNTFPTCKKYDFCQQGDEKSIPALKVVGNEKLGGLKFLQLLGIGLGPWRSISILILNVPFANKKPISVSGLSSNMNR